MCVESAIAVAIEIAIWQPFWGVYRRQFQTRSIGVFVGIQQDICPIVFIVASKFRIRISLKLRDLLTLARSGMAGVSICSAGHRSPN